MQTLVVWIEFIGSWLLFAGPIYQAALELQDEDIELRRLMAAQSKIPKPTYASVWWWFFPPVKIYLDSTSRRDYRTNYIKSLSEQDIQALVSFKSKATAWLYVALGGYCLTIRATYELCHYYRWGNLGLLLLILFMTSLSVLTLIWNLGRAKSIKDL